MAEANEVANEEEKKVEITAKFREFIQKKYEKELIEAANKERSVEIDYDVMAKHKYGKEFCSLLLNDPDMFLEYVRQAMRAIVITPSDMSGEQETVVLRARFFNLPKDVSIRDLRAKHLNKFVSIEGIVRRASEVRPEVTETIWECTECGDKLYSPVKIGLISKPFKCNCGNRIFRQTDKTLIDARWITVEEPFELTEGEKPSQVNLILSEDLVSSEGRRMSDPGNRLKITGILREIPRGGKTSSSKLDIFMQANHVDPKESGWERIEVSKEEEKEIKKMSKDPKIYERLVASLAPTIYGLTEIKESIILQLFGGVRRVMRDQTKFRGDIHILLVGDPASGKSQLLKLAPNIGPRGKYVSGKGTTAAGLCTTYETIVQTDDGKHIKIGDLVENEFKKGFEEMEPGIFISNGDGKKKILSFDSNGMKLKKKRITRFWKLKAPEKLIKIKTNTGKEIKVTADNPIPVLRQGVIKWVKASRLPRGEYIACPRKLMSANGNEISTIDIIDDSAKVLNSGQLMDLIAEKIKKSGTIRDYSKRTGVNEHSLYHSWRSYGKIGGPKFKNLTAMCQDYDIDPNIAFPKRLKLSQYNGKSLLLEKNLTEDMMYMLGLIAGDGSISKTEFGGYDIKFSNSEKWLLDKYTDLCKSVFGLNPSLGIVRDRVPYVRFASKIVAKILREFGIPHGKKARNIRISEKLSTLTDNLLSSYLRGLFDTDGHVTNRKTLGSNHVGIVSASEEFIQGIQLLLLRYGIPSKIRKRAPTTSTIGGRKVVSGDKWALEITSKKNMSKFKEHIGFALPRKSAALEKVISKIKQEHTNSDLVPGIGKLIREARLGLGVSAKGLYGYKNYSYEDGTRKPSRKKLIEIVEKLQTKGNNDALEHLNRIARSDIILEKIKDIELIDNKEHEFVYDVTVEDDHSFMANGMIIHNTATVTKDELMGGWILEAGAIVLANKGLLSIDEFEKMDAGDQVAMHEALEQGSVSIAKASIMATLPAETSVLAGANPKFSRFDAYRSIADQITIVDTLLSRFDLKFILRDVPNAAKDRKLVEHILKARAGAHEETEPEINPALIRKYIAYAKKNCIPKITDETGKLLKDFYLRTRKKAEGGNAPIPITLRQFEALIRLSEASAKIALSDYIRKEDTQRAIKLMQFSLYQLGYDQDTGQIDIDKSEGGTSFSERSRLRKLLDIITALSAKKKEIPVSELEQAAKDEGLDQIDDLLERLKREGMLFEPSPGFVQKI